MSILHLCLDIQKGYPARSPLYASWWGDLKREVGVLAAALEAEKIPTIYLAFGGGAKLENFREGVGFLQDTPQATETDFRTRSGLAFDLALPATALVGYKNQGSAYTEPSFRACRTRRLFDPYPQRRFRGQPSVQRLRDRYGHRFRGGRL